MKKSAITFLLGLTLAFAAFVAGFYVGKNYNHGSIEISGIPNSQLPESGASLSTTAATVPATLDETTQKLMDAINAATLEQWDEVPGIGEATAKKILAYRETYGDFKVPEDLDNVENIGPKTIDKIIDYFLGRLSNEDTGS